MIFVIGGYICRFFTPMGVISGVLASFHGVMPKQSYHVCFHLHTPSGICSRPTGDVSVPDDDALFECQSKLGHTSSTVSRGFFPSSHPCRFSVPHKVDSHQHRSKSEWCISSNFHAVGRCKCSWLLKCCWFSQMQCKKSQIYPLVLSARGGGAPIFGFFIISIIIIIL